MRSVCGAEQRTVAKGNENGNGDAVASVQRAGGGTSGSASGDVCEEGEGI